MPDDSVRVLRCLVEGEPVPFKIRIPADGDIDDLKELVREKGINAAKRPGILAQDLVLLKLTVPVVLKPSLTLVARIQELSNGAHELNEPADQVSFIFPKTPPSDLLHIIIRLPTCTSLAASHAGKRSAEEQSTDEESRKRLKSSLGTVQGSPDQNSELQKLTELHAHIQLIPADHDYYSNPNHIVELPFPSVNTVPERFTLSEKGLISYMGRVCFDKVWKAFLAIQADSRRRQSLYVYGGKGFGKSYIFVALVCLLVRNEKRVVYLPDCRPMLRSPHIYLRNALLFAFAGPASSPYRERIHQCKTVEALADFCVQYRAVGQLYFVVDQLNALDPERIGEDEVSNERKSKLRESLHLMMEQHIDITSASANHKTAMHMMARDAGDKKIPLLGGLTTEEMGFWWKRHDGLFKKFSVADKQRIEDLTGCIPLLLDVFVTHPNEPLEALEPRIWDDVTLASVGRETIDFAHGKRSSLEHKSFHDEFVPLMRAFLMGGYVSSSGVLIDHRYFYLDDLNRGRYTCGLARQAITQFLRLFGEERIFLGAEWHHTLVSYKNNPSAIGFTVEQMIISKIASAGVHLDDFNIPAAKIVAFEGGMTRLSKDRESAYYVPLKFNLKAIDTLFVSVNQKQKTARVVGIQITIPPRHKDSEAAFLADLETWLSGLDGYDVEISFLWIHDGKRGRVEMEAKLTELRGRTVMRWPDHIVYWVSVEQVDIDLVRTLEKIRKNSDG